MITDRTLPPGNCTVHAQICGCGTGVFFIVHKSTPLLIHESRACYLDPLYADANGESNDNSFSSRPMFLLNDRMQRLQELYITHQIPKEVYRSRISSNKLIRRNWY